jgi:hypothetical protein
MQMIITTSVALAGVSIAIGSAVFATHMATEERNARLVEIGVGILRVDPAKDGQIAAARKWALDLIDANAGGVKFSPEARAELLNKRLDTTGWADTADEYFSPNRARKSSPPPQSN